MAKPTEVAQEALDSTKLAYSDRHIFRVVDPQAFRHVNHQYYAKAQTEFEQLGFQKLCDLEDVTFNKTSNFKTYICTLLSGDRSISAGLYHLPSSLWQKVLKIVGWSPKHSFFIDLETECADGTFLLTTTAKLAVVFQQDPRLIQQVCAPDASAQVLLQIHQQRVEAYCASHQTNPLKIEKIIDLLDFQHRLQELKNSYRKKVGFLTTTEVERIADGRFAQSVTDINSVLEESKATSKDNKAS